MKQRTSLFQGDFEDKINSDYVLRPHPVFLEMEQYSKEQNVPSVSPATGKVLQSLVRWKNIGSILELGTGIGYSTLWMLSAHSETRVVTIDRREAQAQKLLEFAKKMQIPDAALNLISHDIVDWCQTKKSDLSQFDLILVDCDKINYPVLAELLWKEIKPGATLVFDNMLWHGRVFQEEAPKPSDQAIHQVWAWAKSLSASYTLVPVGDGLLVLEKP